MNEPEEVYERMKELQKYSKLDVNIVVKRLGLVGKAENVYLWGSRLWGTASFSSDYDFMIVAKGITGHKTVRLIFE